MSSLKEYSSLKSVKQFNYFYNNSKKEHLNSAIVFYKKTNQLQVGFTASKKVGNAVKRNFAKRRLRAIFSTFKDNLNGGTYIFVAKKEITLIDFKKLELQMQKAFKRVGAYKNDKSFIS